MKDLNVCDKILLIKSRNGLQRVEGQVLEIIGIHSNGYTVKLNDGSGTGNVYYSRAGGEADEFCLADRKKHSKYLKTKILKMKKEITTFQKECIILDKYDSEEDFIADKLMELIKSNDRKGVVEILKTMKKSNYI